MLLKSKKLKYISTGFIVLFCYFIILFVPKVFAATQDLGTDEIEIYTKIDSLKDRIQANKLKINNLKARIEGYQKDIANTQKQQVSLQNQLSVLETQILKSELDIQSKQAEIEDIEMEISLTQLQIEEKEEKIQKNKQQIAVILGELNRSGQQNYLEILILNKSFSDFFSQVKYLSSLQRGVTDTLNQIKTLKQELELKKSDLEIGKQELVAAKKDVEKYKSELEEKKVAKDKLYQQSLVSEKTFRNLLYQARQEQAGVDAEVARLENERNSEQFKLRIKQLGGVGLMWPVSPSRGITAYFHDPDYPYRYVYEHPAIDIRAYQSTPVKAAAAGYVGRAKNAGYGYSYITLIHANDLTTVYGHIFKIIVAEGSFVSQGQVIGYSGGMPGTPGAGSLTTGPHLHFEVRKNSLPVNPLNYLP